MVTADCEECGYNVSLENTIQGELIVCPECGTEMEVISIDPPKLELAPAEEEDWGE